MKNFLLLLLAIGMHGLSIAQVKPLSGTVSSKATGEPLSGVTVMLKGSQVATFTDDKGKFSLNVPASGGTLIFSYVGYSTQSADFADQSPLNIILQQTSKTLNEVVVVGYGTQIKANVTGSISSVSGNQIEQTPVTSVEQTLQGKAAGVFVEANNGKVGSAIRVLIRGSSSINANNQPLYVVDGVPINTAAVNDEENIDLNPLNDIDFNNIQSVEILKDAAASAIYGSRGANGVVLITTKHGYTGKTKINFDYQQGWSKPTRLRKFFNSQQYVTYFDSAAVNGGKYDYANGISGYPSEQAAIDDYVAYAHEEFTELSGQYDWTKNEINTDWQSLAFQPASSLDTHLSFSGGTDRLQYFVSGGYSKQVGILLSNAMNRASLLLNLDNKLSDRFDFGMNLDMSRSLNNDVPDDDEFEAPLQIVAQSPLTPEFDSAGNLTKEPTALYFNPLVEAQATQSNIYTFRIIGNFYADFNILPSLTLRGEAGGDITNLSQDRYLGSQSNIGQSVHGYGEVYDARVENYDTKLLLTYKNTFQTYHNLELTTGTEYEPYSEFWSQVKGQGFPNDELKTLSSASKVVFGSSEKDQYRFLSYFARANYNYNGKYLASVSGRYDGSSRFGENNRYGFFPSASLGWIISDENFLKNNKVLSFLKLRTSYGITGNAGIGNYNYLGLYGVSAYKGQPGLYPSTLANPNLTWEKTAQFDAGVDFGFFNDRLNGELDYYLKNTSDLLLDVPVSATTGFLTQLQNVGKIQNTGFEFTVNADVLVKKFKWSTSVNYAANKNKVVALSSGQDLIDDGGSEALSVVKVGQPLGVFYGAEYAGVDPNNGDALWYVNGSEGDRSTTSDYNLANFVVIGNPNPRFIAGMENTFSYGSFSLDVSLQSVYGNDVNLNGDHWMASNGAEWDNQIVDMLKSWQKPGDVTDVPQARLLFENGDQFRSSRYISKASYLRVKTITLSYNLPKKLISKVKLASLRVYASSYNLFTITNYKGWDPEVTTDYYDDNINVGVDFYSAPQPKTIVFGVSIGL